MSFIYCLKSKKSYFLFYTFVIVCSFLTTGCGKLWGGISRTSLPVSGGGTSAGYNILGLFSGAIGKATASTGTCPAAGAVPGWCTGGTFGSGTSDGMFSGPTGVDVDTLNGYIYVGGSDKKISKISLSTGAFVGAIGKTTASTGTCPAAGAAPGWCTGGSFINGLNDGNYNNAAGIALDTSAGVMYVSDYGNKRISKVDIATGAFISAIGKTTASSGTCPAAGAAPGWCTGGSFGSVGTGDGMFSFPSGIAIDLVNGFLYVADSANHRVVKINSSSGAFVGAIGKTTASAGTCPAAGATNSWCTGGTFGSGTGDGMFNTPTSIAIDTSNGLLYVTELFNSRVSKINLTSGAFIGAIGNLTASSGSCPAAGAATGWCTGGTFTSGAGDGMFNAPTGITIDTYYSFIYVNDSSNGRLSKIDLTTGAFIGAVGNLTASSGSCPAAGAATGWCTGGTFTTGTGDGMFNLTNSISLDTVSGNLFVLDSGNGRVVKIY